MPKRIALFSLIVADYDEALKFFIQIGFECREDTVLGDDKRWVRIAVPGAETEILLVQPSSEEQKNTIGAQGGGRVWLFLETEDFDHDLERLRIAGATIDEDPRDEPYGRVVVWSDPWGNRWDLIAYRNEIK